MLAALTALDVVISVDTYFPAVAQYALAAGAHIINDVSGTLNSDMLAVAASCQAGIVLMHAGDGANTRTGAKSIETVHAFFTQALAAAEQAGLARECVCLDPGIGFGSSDAADGLIIARLRELADAFPDAALLAGASRKRVVGTATRAAANDRLAGTLAMHSIAQWNGAHVLRVHDVAAAVQAAAMVDYVRGTLDG